MPHLRRAACRAAGDPADDRGARRRCRGRARIPVVASVVDQQAALYGHGCRTPGDLKITFGTGTFALALTGAAPVTDREGLLPTVAWRRPSGAGVTPSTAATTPQPRQSTGPLRSVWPCERRILVSRGARVRWSAAWSLSRRWPGLPRRTGTGRRPARFSGFGRARLRRSPPAVLEGVALRAAELLEALSPAGTGPVSIDGGMTPTQGSSGFSPMSQAAR